MTCSHAAACLLAIAACSSARRSEQPRVDNRGVSATRSSVTAVPPSCAQLQFDATDPAVANAPALCRELVDQLVPRASSSAIGCLDAAGWSKCDVSSCIGAALSTEPVERDARCAEVERACPGMGTACTTHISGLNTVGRERFARCLAECKAGLRFCLWDPMVTPCL